MNKQVLTDNLVPVVIDGKTYWVTEDQHEQMIQSNKISQPKRNSTLVKEKNFLVPDFLQQKQLISD